MASLTVRSLVLMSCWMMMIAQSKTEGVSPGVLDFLSVFNGNYDNSEQAQESNGTYDLLQTKMIPVSLPFSPFLKTGPVILSLEAVNHVLYRLLVVIVTDGPDENTIYLTPCNFTTDFNQYKLENFTAADLAKFQPEDYKCNENCRYNFRKTSRGAYFGKYTDCKSSVNGTHYGYFMSFDCDTYLANIHEHAKEAKTIISYDMKHTEDRYPLPGAPSDYVPPCPVRKSLK